MDAKGASKPSAPPAQFLAHPAAKIDSSKTKSGSQELLDKKMHVPGIHETGEEANGGDVQ
ncbi:MAG: hypothetical protein ABEJ03_06475 [Candidatus Nanohaloarchaea archaeon]